MVLAVRFAWCAVSVAILFATLRAYDPQQARDADVLMVYGMLCLGFPSSIVAAAMVTLADVLGVTAMQPNSRITIVAVWAFYGAFGYAQWFYLLPALVRRRRRRLEGRSTSIT
jgi:hypothetical protein